MATAAELLVLITARDAASNVIDGLGKSLGGFGAAGKIASVGMTAFTAAGVAVAAGLGSSISAATNFQSAMSAVAAVADGGSEALGALSAKALELGQDNKLAGIGATDAARAMQELAAAGISTQDILEGAARGALLLASAGGIDVASAAEIASNALNAFGLSGGQASHVADLLAGAANASSADVSDLGESLKFIAPVAHSMGISIEDVVATLAELGSQGIKGSQAGTSLRSILASLAEPSQKAAGVIKDLGLQFFDSQGHMRDFAGISEELKVKMAGLTDQQRANALSTIFGNEALSAATILYGEGADGIAKYLGQVNVAGSAAETGRIRNDNLKGSIEQLKSSLETASITLGTAFLPALKMLADRAALAINAAIPFIQAWGPRFVAMLTTGIAAVLNFGRSIGSALGAVIGAFRALLSGQINFSQFIGGMEIFVSTVLGKLGELAGRAAPYLGVFFSAIGTFISGAVPQIAAQMGLWAASFVDWIQTTAIPFLAPRLAAFLSAIGTWVTGTALPAIGTYMLGVATAFTGWISTTAIPYLQTNLPLWLSALSTWITGTALPAIGAAVGQIGAAFGGWITSTAIPYLTTNLPQWLAALQTWITGTAVPAITAALQAAGTAFGDWVATTAVPWVLANLPGWVAAITGWINSTALPAITTAVQGLAGALVSWIRGEGAASALTTWKDVIIGMLADVLILLEQFIGAAAPKLSEWIKSEETRGRMKDLGKAVGDGLADILNALNDLSINGGHRLNDWLGRRRALQCWGVDHRAVGVRHRLGNRRGGPESQGRPLTDRQPPAPLRAERPVLPAPWPWRRGQGHFLHAGRGDRTGGTTGDQGDAGRGRGHLAQPVEHARQSGDDHRDRRG
jgi:TP901 family phage tail tape measure protein